MSKALAFGLLAVGIVLIVLGYQASHSVASNLSTTFTGAPTNRAIWMYAAGVFAAVAGAIGISRGV